MRDVVEGEANRACFVRTAAVGALRRFFHSDSNYTTPTMRDKNWPVGDVLFLAPPPAHRGHTGLHGVACNAGRRPAGCIHFIGR